MCIRDRLGVFGGRWRVCRDDDMDKAGMVWIPRDATAPPMRLYRDASDMADAGAAFVMRIAREHAADDLSTTPGSHCYKCLVQDCPVRSTELLSSLYTDSVDADALC